LCGGSGKVHAALEKWRQFLNVLFEPDGVVVRLPSSPAVVPDLVVGVHSRRRLNRASSSAVGRILRGIDGFVDLFMKKLQGRGATTGQKLVCRRRVPQVAVTDTAELMGNYDHLLRGGVEREALPENDPATGLAVVHEERLGGGNATLRGTEINEKVMARRESMSLRPTAIHKKHVAEGVDSLKVCDVPDLEFTPVGRVHGSGTPCPTWGSPCEGWLAGPTRRVDERGDPSRRPL